MPTARTPAPTAADIAAAIAALSAVPAAAPVKEDGVIKLIVGGVIAFIGFILLGVFGWVGVSVNHLSQTVSVMSANVENLQKSITELQQGQGANSKSTSDLQAAQAAANARTTAIEQDVGRVKERVRILEGQRPLG